MIECVLGGNKSGKSDFGLELLSRGPGPRSIVVTGKSKDLSFREQIRDHRLSRDPSIAVVEVETELASALREFSGHRGTLLVDSLDFWMFSVQTRFSNREARLENYRELLDALSGWKQGNLVLISTEMGLGPLAFDGEVRAFARDLGQLNREIARVSTSVYLVIAGLAQKLK